jgi:Tol biopolymer transport system component
MMNRGKVLLWLAGFCVLVSMPASQCTPSSITPNATRPPTASHFGLVYYSERPNSDGIPTGGFYLVDLQTKEERRLTPESPPPYNGFASWSSVTGKLLYTAGSTMNDTELYLVDFEGHNVRLTDNHVEDSWARWAPDGQTIAFLSRRDESGVLGVYLMDPNGSNIRPVLDDISIFSGEFAWSPDGRRLAVCIEYWSDRPDHPEGLHVVDAETKRILSRLPDDGRSCVRPDWSYDGTKLVYISDYVLQEFIPVYRKIYVLDVRAERETLLADFEAVQSPRWSPVSDEIAFSAGTPQELDIYLARNDGTDLEQLTRGGSYSVGSWSPDGSKLAVTAFAANLAESEIYILNIKSKSLEPVTENSTFDGYPIWVELEK